MVIDPAAAAARHAIIAVAVFLAASCGQPPAPAPKAFSFQHRLGWLHGSCLAISNPDLTRGAAVALVVMAEPQSVISARIEEHTTSPEKCPALMPGRAAINAAPGVFFYTLTGLAAEFSDMAIGIVDPVTPPTVAGNLAQTDLDSDGRPEVFTSCASSEGIKFAVWTGQAYQGEPRWSAYYYLDYDTEPSCP